MFCLAAKPLSISDREILVLPSYKNILSRRPVLQHRNCLSNIIQPKDINYCTFCPILPLLYSFCTSLFNLVTYANGDFKIVAPFVCMPQFRAITFVYATTLISHVRCTPLIKFTEPGFAQATLSTLH